LKPKQESSLSDTNKGLIGIVLVLIVGVLVWGFLTMPDHRSTGQRIGDAVDTLPQGVDKASDQLKDQTPGSRLGDAVEDIGQKIKDNTR